MSGYAARGNEIANGQQHKHGLLLSGKRIHFRRTQMLIWGVIVALLAAAAVAGLYFGILQVHWFPGYNVKRWWDSGMGFIHSGSWPLYRHGAFRDLAEPAIAVMAVKTLITKPRYWNAKPVSTLRLVTAPVIVLALTFGLGILGIWLLNFAVPGLWHMLFGTYVLAGTSWLGKVSAGNLLLGFGIGQVLHRFWAPVGATLQGYQLDRAVDRAQSHEPPRIPLWERWPLMPPVVRERFAHMWRENAVIRQLGPGRKWAIMIVTVVIILLIALGLIGHYYVGTLHHTVPYLAPGK